MDRLFIRILIFATALYFISVYILAWFGVEWYSDFYILFFELAVCRIMTSQGKYHCKYIKYTAYSVAAADTVTRTDGAYDYLTSECAVLLPAILLMFGIVVPFVLALYHYYKVKQLKRKRNGL